MDVHESDQALRKLRAVEIRRQPLVPAEKINAIASRLPATREVGSRHKSPAPSSPTSTPRRCPSPTFSRTTPPSLKSLPKRPLSAERKRPAAATPSSPRSPSTPVSDSSADVHLSSRQAAGSRFPESLWPSTMRSLSVSFQSDTISIPVSKKEKEKPVTSPSDRTLRPASNVAPKKAETPRKATPERIRSPLKGKNTTDQSENSKPVDGLHSRLIDQHRWPSRVGGKVSSSPLNRNIDHLDTTIRKLCSPIPEAGVSSLRRLSLSSEVSVSGTGMPSLRRLSLPGETSKPVQKGSNDAGRLSSLAESGRTGSQMKSTDDRLQLLRALRPASTTQTDKTGLPTAGLRSLSLSRPASPNKASVLSPSSRGLSPSRSRPSTPGTPSSRGLSPTQIRPTSPTSPSDNSTSVMSFIADFKKGKKSAAFIEDAHQLRLIYNRYLQWRFVNARAEDALYIQKLTAERTLYDVWRTTLSMWESIIRKRINLQQLRLELKLNSILNDQMPYLDDWAALESDHVDAVSGAVEDFEASTLRLPVTGGAKADIEHLKVAICSAVDVMQAMGSAICPSLSRVEAMNNLISEVAIVSAQEKALLDECEALLTFAAAMQVEENSLRTHLMQMKQVLEVNK